jgi:hypothetical protein
MRDQSMNKPGLRKAIAHRAASVYALAMLLGTAAFSSHAAQDGAPFVVRVNLDTGVDVPETGLCTVVGAFGASVTVSCSAGAIRFVTQPPAVDKLRDTEKSSIGAGTVTSWRMIRLENGDYLEMTVRW